jgi:hypothetical protein
MKPTNCPQAAEELSQKALGGRRFPDWDAIVFIAVAWLVMSVQAFLIPLRHKENCACWDDFESVPFYVGKVPITPSWLWSCDNEHRIPIAKLVMVAVTRATGNFWAGEVLNVSLLAAIAAALMLGARRLRGQTWFTDAIFPMLLLSQGQCETLVLGTHMLHYGIAVAILYSLLLLIAYQRRTLSVPSAVAVACCLAMLPLCGGVGLTFVPLLGLWLFAGAVHGCRAGAYRSKGTALFMLLLPWLACVPMGLYFIGFRGATFPYAGWFATLRTSLAFLSIGLGSVARAHPREAFCTAAIFCGVSLLLVAVVWRRRPNERLRAAGLGLFLGCFAGLALSVGLARAAAGPGAGYATRYATFVAPMFCGAYFILLLYASQGLARLLQMSLLVVLLLVAAKNHQDLKECCAAREAGWAKIVDDIESGAPCSRIAQRNYQNLYPVPERLTELLEMLRQADWPPFKGAYGANRSAFESSSRSVLKLDPRDGFAGIEPLHEMVIHPQRDSLRITCTGDDPFAMLPKINCPEQSDLVVRCDVVSPAESFMEMYYPMDRPTVYGEDHAANVPIPSGPAVVYLRIPHFLLAGRIRFDPVAAPGEFILKSLEIRAVPSRH